MNKSGRRSFLKAGCLAVAGLGSAGPAWDKARNLTEREAPEFGPGFKLGLVTYQLAQDWDIETIIKNCEATSFEGVELRTRHRHGVEPSIGKAERAEVRKRFEDSHLRLVSLGSTCEYESPDQAAVDRNTEETRRFCELARDVGAMGVKVRPNGFPKDVPPEKTLDQIGRALARCGDAARDLGVEIWLEVHGQGTELPQNIRRIMEACRHPSVGICWNSNDTDVVGGSVKSSFELLKPWLRSCHINELWRRQYPWPELFGLLRSVGYTRYTFAEIPWSCEPIRLMRYYRALWESYRG
jgi:xylose isomerase-like TIM barrel protein